MEQIINGKLYTTETATLLGDYEASFCSDCYYFENLYKTNKGTYFLYGKGEALSHYGIYIGSNLCGSERIKILTEPEARKWAEQCLSAGEYYKIFGAVEEG